VRCVAGNRYTQALYLSEGFSDFEVLAFEYMRVGCESGSREGFMGRVIVGLMSFGNNILLFYVY